MVEPIDVKRGQYIFCAVMFNFRKINEIHIRLNTILHPNKLVQLAEVNGLMFGLRDKNFQVSLDPSEGAYTYGIYFGAPLGAGQRLPNEYAKSVIALLNSPEIKKLFIPYQKMYKMDKDVSEVYLL
jgi:hypothetical protein